MAQDSTSARAPLPRGPQRLQADDVSPAPSVRGKSGAPSKIPAAPARAAPGTPDLSQQLNLSDVFRAAREDLAAVQVAHEAPGKLVTA